MNFGPLVDGDTVDVRNAEGVEERVRIIGIDTPERGECGFSEARQALAALVLGERVQLEAGARDDRDGVRPHPALRRLR